LKGSAKTEQTPDVREDEEESGTGRSDGRVKTTRLRAQPESPKELRRRAEDVVRDQEINDFDFLAHDLCRAVRDEYILTGIQSRSVMACTDTGDIGIFAIRVAQTGDTAGRQQKCRHHGTDNEQASAEQAHGG
jgi:hypothetical protein